MFSALALASFDAADPVLRMGPVSNLGGALGASIAGLLHQGLGDGAFAFLALVAFVSVRVLAGLPAARDGARFWIGSALVGIAAVSVPELLREIAPARFGALSGGALGATLAGAERALLGGYGALVGNAFLLTAGILRVLGIPAEAALRAMAAGATAAGHAGLRAGASLERSFDRFGVLLRRASAGLRRASEDVRVWRERRRRRRRVALLHAEEAQVAADMLPPVKLVELPASHAEPEVLPALPADDDAEDEGEEQEADAVEPAADVAADAAAPR